MPKDPTAPVAKRPFVDRRGQLPITRVLDMVDYLAVDVVSSPCHNHELIVNSIPAFTKACHLSHIPSNAEVKDMGAPLHELMAGGALWQAMELLDFTIAVRFCTRVFTHQLVRARVGITYSQQCFGDHDARHADVMVPRCFTARQTRAYVDHAIAAKQLYCQMVDDGVSVQEARYVLPHSLATFIYAHATVNTLGALYAKRSCTMTQAWETYLFAERLKAAMVRSAPWVGPVFRSPCDTGSCYYHKAKDSGFAITGLWAPDMDHDTHPWNPESYAHGEKDHWSVSASGTRTDTEHFVGDQPVSYEAWAKNKEEYHV